jgi:hypothetical protein
MKTLSHSLLKNNIYIYTRESTNFCRVYNKFRQKILRTDVFVIQPIGSVKSLIYQSAPAVFDIVRPVSKGKSISLVISPLTSLMQDLMLRNNLTEKAFGTRSYMRTICVSIAFHFMRSTFTGTHLRNAFRLHSHNWTSSEIIAISRVLVSFTFTFCVHTTGCIQKGNRTSARYCT